MYTYCYINESYYPYEWSIQTENSIDFMYYSRGSVKQPYCYSCSWYFNQTGTEICSECDLQQTYDYSLQSLLNQTPGCLACDDSGQYDEILTYLPQLDLNIRDCQQITSSQNQIEQCGYQEYFDQISQSCLSCSDKFPNCASCTSSQCLVCNQFYYLHPAFFDTAINQTVQACIFDTCPKGYCKNEQNASCQICSISNCLMCEYNSNQQQTCIQCSSGYMAQTVNGVSSCVTLLGTAMLNYFISGNAPVLSSGFNYNPTFNDGSTPDLAQLFIQEAIVGIYNYTQTNPVKTVNANIYLASGNHSYFTCNGGEATYISSDSTLSTFVNYCQILKLGKVYFTLDNININIQPMKCSDATTLGYQNNLAYKKMCVNDTIKNKPLIFVSNSYDYFNISGSLTIQNVKFTGVNSYVLPTTKKQDLSVFPLQLCQIASTPLPGDTLFNVSKVNTTIAAQFSYSCVDQQYSGSSIPFNLNASPRCKSNGNNKFYPIQRSTLNCSGDMNSSSFFYQDSNGVYSKRRKTLFNLYAFPSYLSVYQNPPTLNLSYCDFSYFMGGYQTLVNVETDNLQKIVKTQTSQIFNYTLNQYQNISTSYNFFRYQGNTKGVRILITYSTFSNSRFCFGMILHRSQAYMPQIMSLVNMTLVMLGNTPANDTGAYISLQNSQFTNLNAMTNVTALAIYEGNTPNKLFMTSSQLEALSYNAVINKGIVLNVEDFGGQVQVLGCTFQYNMHFIPEIQITPWMSNQTQNAQTFRDASVTHEYQFSICDQVSLTDQFFFQTGISSDDDIDTYFDSFERLGVIYISRNKQPMIFQNSFFYNNTGTFGGAITINSPNWVAGKRPYVVIMNCSFVNNLAYFSGNGLYVRNTMLYSNLNYTCGGVHMQDSWFQNNIGFKAHNGGGAAVVCMYLIDVIHEDIPALSQYLNSYTAIAATQNPNVQELVVSTLTILKGWYVYAAQLAVVNTIFQENYTGRKGSGLYLRYISNTYIDSSQFIRNGPIYTYRELQYSPYTQFFSKKAMTYAHLLSACSNEFLFLQQQCQVTYTSFDWSHIRGALHIWHCVESNCLSQVLDTYSNYTMSINQKFLMTNSYFLNNDVGGVFDLNFPIDLAASLYLLAGLNNTIVGTSFIGHNGSNNNFSLMLPKAVQSFFPTLYYQYAQAPIVKYITKPSPFDLPNSSQYINLTATFIQCTFYQNKHYQVVALTYLLQYFGSLISVDSTYESDLNFVPYLSIQNCSVRDNFMVGNQSTNIYLYKAILIVDQTKFIGNGIYTKKSFTKLSLYPFLPYSSLEFSTYGLVHLIGMEQFPPRIYHSFTNNVYIFNVAQTGACHSLEIDRQFALFMNNYYAFNFGQKYGTILYTRNQDGRTTVKMINETANMNFGVRGHIEIKSEINDYLNLLVYNSTFKNQYGTLSSAFFVDSAAYTVVQNCTFFRDLWPIDRMAYVFNQFNYINSSFTLNSFIDNSTLKSLTTGVITSYLYFERTFNTQDVYWLDQLIYKASDPYSFYVDIVDCTFYNLSTNVEGSVIQIDVRAFARIRNTIPPNLTTYQRTFYNNSQSSYGVIYGNRNATIIAENLYMLSNTAVVRGNVIALTSSYMNVSNTTFNSNYGALKGTVYINLDSVFACDQCYFYNNSASDSSGVYAISNQLGYVNISRSVFINNTHFSNLINMVYSIGSISDSIFIDNVAQVVNHGITLSTGQAIISNITVNYTSRQFLNNIYINTDSGFFNINYQSNLQVRGSSVFSNCRGAIASVLYATGSSRVLIEDNTLVQGGFSASNAAFYITITNYITIQDSTFKGNGLSDIILNKATINITNTTFIQTQQQSIYAINSYVQIQNSTFKNAQSQISSGKAIWCQCYTLTVLNSKFRNLQGLEGGAIYLSSSSAASSFLIKNNSFSNNVAMQGGAIKVQDAAYLVIDNNNFINNHVENLPDSSYSVKLIRKGLGGAINFDCYNQQVNLNQNCTLIVRNSNNFTNNSAIGDGGAILHLTSYVDDETNIYNNNTATYGDNKGSYASQIIIQYQDNNDFYDPIQNDSLLYTADSTPDLRRLFFNTNIKVHSGRELTGSNLTFNSVVSGVGINFLIYILDQDGNLYTSDSSSQATMKLLSNDVIVQNEQAIAKMGIYNFSNFIVTLVPGTSANFQLVIKGMQSYGKSIGFLDNPLSITINTRPCVSGEEYTIDNRCQQCTEGQYLYTAPSHQTNCLDCPAEAYCYGLYHVAPKPGYWRSSNTSNDFIACPNEYACLGGSIDDPVGNCSEGYEGIICGNCQSGFKRTAAFKCSICPNETLNQVQLVGIILAVLAVCVFLVRSTIQSADKEKPLYTVYIKILANHFQMISTISNIDFTWPSEIQAMQSSQGQVGGFSSQLFSFDCFLAANNDGTQGTSERNEKVYFQKLLFFTLLPILITLGSLCFWIPYGLIKKQVGQVKHKLISTIVVLLFLVHPNIAQVLFSTFNCMSIDGVERLKENIDLICYQDAHLKYVIFLVIPGVVIWVLGIPLMALILLYKNRHKIQMTLNMKEVMKQEKQSLLDLKIKYGFLFNGYKPDRYYWEVIILYRKIFMVMVTVLLSIASTDAQILVTLLILIITMIIQNFFHPFYTRTLNIMEYYSIQVSCLTIYIGLFYVSSQDYAYSQNNGLKWFFLLLLIVPNVIFFGYWLFNMQIEFLKLVYIKSPKVFQMITCYLYSTEKFENKYIGENADAIMGRRGTVELFGKADEVQDDFDKIEEDKTPEDRTAITQTDKSFVEFKKKQTMHSQIGLINDNDSQLVSQTDINLEFPSPRKQTNYEQEYQFVRNNSTAKKNGLEEDETARIDSSIHSARKRAKRSARYEYNSPQVTTESQRSNIMNSQNRLIPNQNNIRTKRQMRYAPTMYHTVQSGTDSLKEESDLAKKLGKIGSGSDFQESSGKILNNLISQDEPNPSSKHFSDKVKEEECIEQEEHKYTLGDVSSPQKRNPQSIIGFTQRDNSFEVTDLSQVKLEEKSQLDELDQSPRTMKEIQTKKKRRYNY